ncbi:MAG: thioredoxin domain-containing protein [bacterium]|nr:thioredoxin domain-containing protein [bacterium]
MLPKQNLWLGTLTLFAVVALGFFAVSVLRQPGGSPKPRVLDTDPFVGKSNAKIDIVVFTDFQCEFCKAEVATLKSVLAAYQDKVRLVHKDYPLPAHQAARRAAEIARCAQDQQKFWQMYDVLFAHQADLGTVSYETLAKEGELDAPALASCMERGDGRARVDESLAEGRRLLVTEVPTTYVNDQRFVGIVTESTLRAAIQELL